MPGFYQPLILKRTLVYFACTSSTQKINEGQVIEPKIPHENLTAEADQVQNWPTIEYGWSTVGNVSQCQPTHWSVSVNVGQSRPMSANELSHIKIQIS